MRNEVLEFESSECQCFYQYIQCLFPYIMVTELWSNCDCSLVPGPFAPETSTVALCTHLAFIVEYLCFRMAEPLYGLLAMRGTQT